MVVKNVTNDQESSVNAASPLKAASLYKLFVAQYLYEQRAKNQLSFTKAFTPSADAYRIGESDDIDDGKPSPWKTGQQLTISGCIGPMIFRSENICGYALSREVIGESTLNAYVKSEGYQQTCFSGCPATGESNQTSAQDVATLLAKVAEGSMVNKQASEDLEDLLQQQQYRQKIPAGIPGVTVGNKTGELTSGTSHDSAIVRAGKITYVLVVMTQLKPTDSYAPIRDLSANIYTALTGESTEQAFSDSTACVSGTVISTSTYKSLQFPFYDSVNSECSYSDSYSVVTIDGYAFPIAAGKKSDIDSFGGALSLLPCNSAGGCHHNETRDRGGFAFDIGVKGYGPDRSENAPVYAISDGTVQRVDRERNGAPCTSFQLESSKDGYSYWYGHLASNPSIRNGQRVRVGQQIGKVGPSICADRTAPHLHIDRGYPKGHGGGQTCCRDEGIIPLINKLYEALPD